MVGLMGILFRMRIRASKRDTEMVFIRLELRVEWHKEGLTYRGKQD